MNCENGIDKSKCMKLKKMQDVSKAINLTCVKCISSEYPDNHIEKKKTFDFIISKLKKQASKK